MNTSSVNMSAEALEKMITEINDARLKEKMVKGMVDFGELLNGLEKVLRISF